MKNLITAIVAALSLSACTFTVGSGGKSYTLGVGSNTDNVLTRTVELSPFETLECSVPADVIYESGDPKIVIVAGDKAMDHILVEQIGDKVTVKLDSKKLRGIGNTKIYVTSRHLNSLILNGAVDFETKGGISNWGDFSLLANGAADVGIASLKSEKVSILCNGAADVELDGLHCSEISVTINGAADVDIEGITSLADLTINGAGEINITGLRADKVLSAVRGIGSISRKSDD